MLSRTPCLRGRGPPRRRVRVRGRKVRMGGGTVEEREALMGCGWWEGWMDLAGVLWSQA